MAKLGRHGGGARVTPAESEFEVAFGGAPPPCEYPASRGPGTPARDRAFVTFRTHRAACPRLYSREAAPPVLLRPMLFSLKKAMGYCVMPVPVFLALLVVGVVLLWSSRRARLGRVILTGTAILFALLSNKAVSGWLARPLESRYPAIPELTAGIPPQLARCRYVVVLGSGNGNTPGLSAINELSPSARGRITEAARILRRLPEARLLVSGPAEGRHVTHATVLERAAISLGIDASRIERIEHARDTEDEASAVRRRVGDQPCALVTSAWHMPRAVALFRSAGLDPLPCPADFAAHSDGSFRWKDLLWDVESLERSSFAVRERVGYLWITLRGKT